MKKAQVSLYVIIGLVILIAALLVFFLMRENTEGPGGEPTIINLVADVDEEYRPVQLYVQQCMESLATSGLERLGSHGGYIDPLGNEADISLNFDPTDIYNSDGLLLTTQESSFVPFWLSSKLPMSEDLVYPTYTIPTEDDMSRRLQDYVDSRLIGCINEFEDLEREDLDVIIEGEPQSTIFFTYDSVALRTDLDLTVESNGGTLRDIDEFLVYIDIPFLKYYNTARVIASKQYEGQYLEKLPMALVGYYGRIDRNALPPFYETDNQFTATVWTQVETRMYMEQLLQSYVSLLRVENTDNNNLFEGETPEEQAFYDALILPLFLSDNTELSISHLYLGWPIYSKIHPTDGSLIAANVDTIEFPYTAPSQENTYEFYYDLTYPVIVEIREKNLTQGKDFTFLFAMEANVRKNRNWQDYLAGGGPILWDESWLTLDDDGSREIFDPFLNETMTTSPRPEKILFGDEEQFLSGNISLNVVDAFTGEPIPDVDVRVGVGVYASTKIGKTKLDSLAQASFTGPGPVVYNGYLEIKKPGYLSHFEFLSLDVNESINLGTLKLYEKQEKNFTVQIMEMIPTYSEEGYLLGYNFTERPLNPTESVFFTLSRIPFGNDKSSLNLVVSFVNNDPQIGDLVPGRYTLTATLIDEEGVVIPKNTKKICDSDDSCDDIPEDKQWIPYEDVEMKPSFWGGLELNETYGWFLTQTDTYSDEKIILKALKFPPPTSLDSLSMVGELEKYSAQYRSQLIPEVVS